MCVAPPPTRQHAAMCSKPSNNHPFIDCVPAAQYSRHMQRAPPTPTHNLRLPRRDACQLKKMQQTKAPLAHICIARPQSLPHANDHSNHISPVCTNTPVTHAYYSLRLLAKAPPRAVCLWHAHTRARAQRTQRSRHAVRPAQHTHTSQPAAKAPPFPAGRGPRWQNRPKARRQPEIGFRDDTR